MQVAFVKKKNRGEARNEMINKPLRDFQVGPPGFPSASEWVLRDRIVQARVWLGLAESPSVSPLHPGGQALQVADRR